MVPMASEKEKSGTPLCSQDVLNWTCMSLANWSTIAFRDHGFILLLIILSLYNLWKFTSFRRIWASTCGFLVSWLSGQSIDKRIDAMTADLRMEMRELTEQIIEFQKWSQITSLVETTRSESAFCRQCGGKMPPPPRAEMPFHRSEALIHPAAIDNKMSGCNWFEYLSKYVYNPNPRILDTSELENVKRAYYM